MTPKELKILKKLGFDTSKSKEEILSNLIILADYFFEEINMNEQERFTNEIKRLTKPTN